MRSHRLQLRPDLALCWLERGRGRSFVFQHGLGGDSGQTLEVFPDGTPFRCITIESRGHGGSDLGPQVEFGFQTLVEDIAAVLDRLAIERTVVGGISMGAAVALDFALRWPERVDALVVARPGFALGRPSPNLDIFRRVAALMVALERDRLQDTLQAEPAFQAIQAASPDNAQSLLHQFSAEDLETRAFVLERIASSLPKAHASDLRSLTCPALVLGNGEDLIHPLTYAAEIAEALPNATLKKITSKSVSRDRYVGEFKQALAEFLKDLS